MYALVSPVLLALFSGAVPGPGEAMRDTAPARRIAMRSLAMRIAGLGAYEYRALSLYDLNRRKSATIFVRGDGFVDGDTAASVADFFTCRRSGRSHVLDRGLLAILVDVADRYPNRVIEVISGYRAAASEPPGSPHLAARAVDFRIRGVDIERVRDYVWRTWREAGVGVGYYPHARFIHVDHRPHLPSTAWTQYKMNTGNVYRPQWSWSEGFRTRVLSQPGLGLFVRP